MRISVELDRSDPLPDGRVMVKLVLFKAGRVRWSTGIHVDPSPKAWDKVRRRVRVGQRDGMALNKAIDDAIARAEGYVAADPSITPAVLRDRLKSDTPGANASLADALLAYHERNRSRYKYGTRRQNTAAIGYVRKAIPRATLEGFSRIEATALGDHLLGLRVVRGGVSQPLKPNSRRSTMRKIRTLYRGACDDAGLTPKDVFRGLIPAEVKTIKRFAKDAEVAKLEAFTSDLPSERLAVHTWLLQYHLGGLRIGDACRLHTSMIEDGAFRWIEGKVPKPRYHPINPEARAIMDLYPGVGYVLPHLRDGMNEDQVLARIEGATTVINEALKAICARLGISRVTTHNARHTAAKRIKALTSDIHIAKRILGHSKIAQTEVYLDDLDNSDIDAVFVRMRKG